MPMRNAIYTAIGAVILFALSSRCLAAAATLSGNTYELSISTTGGISVVDKETKVAWTSRGLGQVQLASGQRRDLSLTNASIEQTDSGILALCFIMGQNRPNAVMVTFSKLKDGHGFEVGYSAGADLKVESVSLLDGLFVATREGAGYVLAPVREGMLIPADSGLAFNQRFDTYAYEGCHMAMLGLVENKSALLLSWTDTYVAAHVASITNSARPAQKLTASLNLRKSARAFQVRLLGQGDHVTIAKAYRDLAKEAGWLVTWDKKLKQHPERAALFGAINYKLWSTLDRRMNEDSSKELSSRVNWTFDEAAQVAEHLKHDLELEKVLFMIGGWIHRGYDNQHPDVLPAAPECGGDEAFAECGQRIRDLGYMYCLHDNYQDIYRDSPSWNEDFIMKTPDGKLAKGGHWAGGVAYLTCAKKALELAQRPQNLLAIKKLSGANSFFIDTTYASGLQECFDPAHPLTRADDMHWKQQLSDYAREVFGTFGSECGREWAIPHSDFFEGLTGVSGGYYHDATLHTRLGAVVVPLFELVYRDCIAMYGKYGYDPYTAANYVLHHISLGRPLNYHSIPPHLYWKSSEQGTLPVGVSVAQFKQTGRREFEVAYAWHGKPQVTNTSLRAFVHFNDNSGTIKFQNDYVPAPSVAQWASGSVTQGPFTVKVPEGLTGTFTVRAGLFDPVSGVRMSLQGRDGGERSYALGRLKVTNDGITLDSAMSLPSPGDPALFTRGDNGWTEDLHSMDRFVKNTYEILSPLNEITARLQMTAHEFLSADRKAQHTVFGTGNNTVSVSVNGTTSAITVNSKLGGDTVLPPGGFLVDSPQFVAFYASAFGGEQYSDPPLFTLRSLDNRALERSRKIQVFHGFGASAVPIKGRTYQVVRSAVIP